MSSKVPNPLSRLRPVVLVGAIAMALWSIFGLFEVALVPTSSMERTVLVGDHILVSKLLDAPTIPGTTIRLARLRAPRRGEIISFRFPGAEGVVYLKRVVALGGDTVEMRGGTLYVNGTALREEYAQPEHLGNMKPRTIAPGQVFVLGDNRDNSEDSRAWGPVPVEAIVGRPWLVLWSFRGTTRDWLDAHGNLRINFYWTAVRHLASSTRWGRAGTWL